MIRFIYISQLIIDDINSIVNTPSGKSKAELSIVDDKQYDEIDDSMPLSLPYGQPCDEASLTSKRQRKKKLLVQTNPTMAVTTETSFFATL